MSAAEAALRQVDGVAGAEPFLAFAADEATSAEIMEAARRCGFGDAAVMPIRDGLRDCLLTLSQVPTPDLLVVDLADSGDVAADVEMLADVCDPGCRVVVIGTANDVSLYKSLIGLGVDDYLLKPVTAESLATVLARREEPAPVPAEAKPATEGRTLAVVGVHGGAGATTVATNVAWWASEQMDRRVSLVDLDLVFGTTGLALDLEPGKGLVDALANPSRVDELFVKRAGVAFTENLSVFASEAGPGGVAAVDADAVASFVGHLRTGADLVVIDLPRHVIATVPDLLAVADTVLLISEPSLAGMRDTLRLCRMIDTANGSATARVLLNRVGRLKKGELPRQTFESAIERKVDAIVPEDVKAAGASLTDGTVMAAAARHSPVTKAFARLSRDLFEAEGQPAAKRSLWRRLRGR